MSEIFNSSGVNNKSIAGKQQTGYSIHQGVYKNKGICHPRESGDPVK
jgi:hypothetical protein